MKYARWILVFSTLIAPLMISVAPAEEGDLFEKAPWSGSAGLGYMMLEGDEEVENSPFLSLKLGYDFNPRWTVEGDFNLFPHVPKRDFSDPRRSVLTDDTWALRLGLDVLFHLRNVEDLHFDPYLSGGVGWIHWGDELNNGQDEGMVIGGAGLFYHFNDEWAVRADARSVIAGNDTEVNLLLSAGVNWRWGARVPAAYEVSGGDIDSDGDGLLDSVEAEIGTDPYNPDTDQDGLSDGQEVNQYRTDPLKDDSDWDGLKDGPEVLTYKTDPLDRDTDKGGVADGHEVIEDNTNPLDPSDDLQLFTLDIEFDYDKADIRQQYYDDLDVIVKVLRRDPGAIARIEGHADKRPKSSRKYNLRLSKRRAKAVEDYLVNVGGIDRSRLTAVGYGFDRPIAPNDTEANMQKNRRVEVYIRRSGESEDQDTAQPQKMP